MTWYVLVVGLVVNGQLEKELITGVRGYDNLQACEAAASRASSIQPITVAGNELRLAATCQKQEGAHFNVLPFNATV